MCATNHPNFGFTGIIWKYAFSARKLASSRYMRADIYAGQMWLLIILLARHLHAYGELSINYCERRLKVFFFSDNHLAFLSHVQILHAFNYSDISLVASVACRRNRYPDLKDVQNKGSDPQKLIRGRSRQVPRLTSEVRRGTNAPKRWEWNCSGFYTLQMLTDVGVWYIFGILHV